MTQYLPVANQTVILVSILSLTFILISGIVS